MPGIPPRKLHRWGKPVRPTPPLTIRECVHCGMTKHGHHESEGGRPLHWNTFHGADGRRIPGYSRKETPPCRPMIALIPAEDTA